MKTIKFKLFATMITLAAITIIATIPVNAQRRSTQRSSEKSEPARSRNMKSTVEKKSTFKDYDKREGTRVNPNLKSTQKHRSNKSTPTANRNTSSKNRKATANTSQRQSSRQSSPGTFNSSGEQSRKSGSQPEKYRSQNSRVNNGQGVGSKRTMAVQMSKRSDRTTNNRQYASKNSNTGSSYSTSRRSTGNTVSSKRDFYRADKSDRRYEPNRNYKGSNKYWSNNHRPNNMNYNHKKSKYYKGYNQNKYNHWDRSWERYRWNYSSWHDYYNGYHPYSYRYHKYYYHHHRYGHVIRRFDYRPQVFIHNHHNYYCYNGHFFRYRSGIGYILVDIPFGLSFEYLPHNYEQVYINGFLYFRVGNLFFEWANSGFRLVHYPERYYAFDDGYNNYGYRFYDDY